MPKPIFFARSTVGVLTPFLELEALRHKTQPFFPRLFDLGLDRQIRHFYEGFFPSNKQNFQKHVKARPFHEKKGLNWQFLDRF